MFFKEISKSKTSDYRTSSIWFSENYFKTLLVCEMYFDENYNMHSMLRCFHLLENKEHLLEHILNILDVNKQTDSEKQTIENQYINLLGCTTNASFENTTFGKWKLVMQCVSFYIYKIRNRFSFLLQVLAKMCESKLHYTTKHDYKYV